MTDESDFLTASAASIDDYLLGIADGLNKAQRQLSQMSLVAREGESAITYQIPRLDFELKMSLEMTVQSGDGGPTGQGPSSGGPMMRFRPVGAQRGGSQSTAAEATSIIKGAFVAVPVRGGKPPPVIQTTLMRVDRRRLEVRVSVRSAAGERLSGVEVHFNVDRDQSRKLQEGAVGRFDEFRLDSGRLAQEHVSTLRPETDFWDGMVPTDANGLSVGVLGVDFREPIGTRVVVVVDVLGNTETILFEVE